MLMRPGARAGFEFDSLNLEAIINDVSETAIRISNAEKIKPQIMTVVLNNGLVELFSTKHGHH